jgi:hypothetical protein
MLWHKTFRISNFLYIRLVNSTLIQCEINKLGLRSLTRLIKWVKLWLTYIYSLLLLSRCNPNPIHEHQLPTLSSSAWLALMSILCKKKNLSTKNLQKRILISNNNLIPCFRPWGLLLFSFFFFFLTCPHKRGEGGFELVTSAS